MGNLPGKGPGLGAGVNVWMKTPLYIPEITPFEKFFRVVSGLWAQF
jgi:hypothetical protein